MIATAKRAGPRAAGPSWQPGFLQMLPEIQRHLRGYFAHLGADAQEEALQEAVANCLVVYRRLFLQGRVALAYPSVLARFAVLQVRAGRRIGTTLNVRDVSSAYCQLAKGIRLQRLDAYCRRRRQWIPAAVTDPRAPVADQAALRVDLPSWLATLSRRNRRIAWNLACGATTSEVARQFGLSAGRVSQLRGELVRSWHDFHGEEIGAFFRHRRGHARAAHPSQESRGRARRPRRS